jgi:threonine/homoserine/homoserine lactone efflux protein
MGMYAYILQGIGLGFSAAVQPGPFMTYLVSRTLGQGWRRALPAVLAPLVSDGPIIAVMLLVLTRVPGWLEKALSIAGGLYILYLGWRAYRNWTRSADQHVTTFVGQSRGVLSAALVNALSPGPYIYWSFVTGPILIAAWKQSATHGIGFLAGFYGAMVGSLVVIVGVFATARRLGPRVNRALLGVSAVALVCFGLYQLWSGLS